MFVGGNGYAAMPACQQASIFFEDGCRQPPGFLKPLPLCLSGLQEGLGRQRLGRQLKKGGYKNEGLVL
jgi:hypothetical protein